MRIINLLLIFFNVNIIVWCQNYADDQMISFKKYYSNANTKYEDQNPLPFYTPINDLLYDANGYCYVALTEDGLMWSSRRKFPTPLKLSMENKYNDFILVHNISNYITLNPLEYNNDEKVLKFTKAPDSIIIATSSSLIELVMDFYCTRLVSIERRLTSYEVNEVSVPSWGNVYAMESSQNSLWFSTNEGLFQSNYNTINELNHWYTLNLNTYLNNDDNIITSLYYVTPWNVLYVGTSLALYDITYDIELNIPISVSYEWIGGNIANEVISMDYDCINDLLLVIEKDSLHIKDINGLWHRQGHLQGAITSNLTTMSFVCNEQDTVTVPPSSSVPPSCFVYMGTSHMGVVRRQYTSEIISDTIKSTNNQFITEWMLINGERYLPASNHIIFSSWDDECKSENKLNTNRDTTILLVTELGISYITSEEWKYSDMELVYNNYNSRHNRNGLNAEISLETYGDINSYYYRPNENDGIWTSQYAILSTIKYYLTKDKNDQLTAWNAFDGLYKLNTITGVPGLIASTFCSPNEISQNNEHPTIGCGTDGVDNWHRSTSLPGGTWLWKGGSSSDTINGHYFAYSMLYDLLAGTHNEKNKIVNLIINLTNYIINHNYYYIDINGQITKSGIWNPNELNNNPIYYNIRGLNSLQILSFLAITFSMTGDITYYNEYQKLAVDNKFYMNILNQKINNPYNDNHADNHISFMAYHTLFYAKYRLDHITTATEFKYNGNENDIVPMDKRRTMLDDMVTPIIPSLKRWSNIVRSEYSPLWSTVIAGAAELTVLQSDIMKIKQNLKMWPLDLIDWDVQNSNRWDCFAQPYGDRGDITQSIMYDIPPMTERQMQHWNINPFLFDSGTSKNNPYTNGGYVEYASTEWLLPYWMMRFYDLISNEE
jgi:hypothetical protein